MENLLKYGNELEISGMILANGKEQHTILFPEASRNLPLEIVLQPTHEEWKTLLYQLDTLGVEGLNKIILRKSQRNIEQTISWNVFRRDSYTCQYCAANDVPLTVDHIVTWEKDGASVEDNLISSCKRCNKTRGPMEFPDWLKSDYLQRVIQNFGCNILEQETKLLGYFSKAIKVPLRPTPRKR